MKKIIVAALLAVSCSVFAAEEPAQMLFTVRVTKGTSAIGTFSVMAINGKTAPVSVEKETTYRATTIREGGKIKIIPGTMKTGFAATLTPEIQKDGQIKTHITLRLSDLVSMKPITTADGLEIDLVDIDSKTMVQDIVLGQEKPVSFAAGDYTIQVAVKNL